MWPYPQKVFKMVSQNLPLGEPLAPKTLTMRKNRAPGNTLKNTPRKITENTQNGVPNGRGFLPKTGPGRLPGSRPAPNQPQGRPRPLKSSIFCSKIDVFLHSQAFPLMLLPPLGERTYSWNLAPFGRTLFQDIMGCGGGTPQASSIKSKQLRCSSL